MKIEDIAFWVLIAVGLSWLIWELIPDSAKKWWNYGRMVRQDRKRGKSRSYIFTFRNGVNREK